MKRKLRKVPTSESYERQVFGHADPNKSHIVSVSECRGYPVQIFWFRKKTKYRILTKNGKYIISESKYKQNRSITDAFLAAFKLIDRKFAKHRRRR